MKSKDYGLVFWVHSFVNVILFFSWFIFSWWLVLIGALVLQMQFRLLGGCVLSRMEFGTFEESCIPYYFTKWGLIKNKFKSMNFFRLGMPLIIVALSIVWQVLLKHHPLL